jgi:hypothetical protein
MKYRVEYRDYDADLNWTKVYDTPVEVFWILAERIAEEVKDNLVDQRDVEELPELVQAAQAVLDRIAYPNVLKPLNEYFVKYLGGEYYEVFPFETQPVEEKREIDAVGILETLHSIKNLPKVVDNR